MLFSLEVLPAAEGDCLLLHWGSASQPRLAVIDGGPGTVYENTLQPRLEEIADKRGGPLSIELVMVSHVDNDHIVGIKKLFRQLKNDVQKNTPAAKRLAHVRFLWHNTFNDVLDDAMDAYYKKLPGAHQASINGQPNPELTKDLVPILEGERGLPSDEAREAADEVALLLAGHGEGRDLRDSYKFLSDANEIGTLNYPFKKNGKATLISAERTPAPREVSGLTVTIIGPMEDELAALQKEFDKYITAKGLTAEAMLAAYTDRSVPNLSSIACLVEVGGKSILLTGDARGDKVLAGLDAAGRMQQTPLKVDVLKAPHHGSARNLAKDFFDKIHADTYVFSANGKYENPDRETLEWLIDARGKAATYDIVLTYPVTDIDTRREAEYVKKGQAWKDSEDALATLFSDRKSSGFRFEVTAAAPTTIDLGDESPGV